MKTIVDIQRFPCKCVFYEFTKLPAMRARVPAWSTWQCTCVLVWFACQRDTRGNVPASQRVKSMPTSHFTCQRTTNRVILRANVSTLHASAPNAVPIFWTFLLRNAKGNSILHYYTKNSTLNLISELYIQSCRERRGRGVPVPVKPPTISRSKTFFPPKIGKHKIITCDLHETWVYLLNKK